MILVFTFATEAERDKFERIYEAYKGLMLHKAYGILHDRSLAEDAVSEAFIRVYKNLHKIEDAGDGRCAAFVATIARNCALTLLEKEKRGSLEEYDDSLQDDFDLEQSTISALSSDTIYAMVGGLEEAFRSVFLLRYAYDMSHKEIGKALGISENNVTVRLHRAKKKLAAMLRKEGYACEAD